MNEMNSINPILNLIYNIGKISFSHQVSGVIIWVDVNSICLGRNKWNETTQRRHSRDRLRITKYSHNQKFGEIA